MVRIVAEVDGHVENLSRSRTPDRTSKDMVEVVN